MVRWRDEGRRFRIFTRVLAGLNYSKLVHDAYLSSYLLSRISSSNFFFFFFFLYLIVDPLVPPLFITFSYFSTDRRVLMNSSSPPLDSSFSRIFFSFFFLRREVNLSFLLFLSLIRFSALASFASPFPRGIASGD